MFICLKCMPEENHTMCFMRSVGPCEICGKTRVCVDCHCRGEVKKKETEGQPARVPEDYRHIKAWGILMRSFPSYIKGQQTKACRDGAPVTAVYFNDNEGVKKWIILSHCAKGTQEEVRHIMRWMK